MVQRVHARPHELRRQPAQHSGAHDADGQGGKPGRSECAGREQRQPHHGLGVLRQRRRRAPDFKTGGADDPGRGIPAAILGPHLPDRPSGPSDLALPHRLRRHRDRQPVSVQHRHVPQGQSAGRHHRLRARVFGRWRSAAACFGRRKGVPDRCRAGHGRLPGMVDLVARLPSGLASCAEQRFSDRRHGRGRFEYKPASPHHARQRPDLRLSGAETGSARLDGRRRQGPQLRKQRPAARVSS